MARFTVSPVAPSSPSVSDRWRDTTQWIDKVWDGTGWVYIGRPYIDIPGDLDYTRIIGLGKPTQVYRGIFKGYSLPIYAADDEELFHCIQVPASWDGSTDITVRLCVWLDTANTNKKFNLEVAWEHTEMGVDVIPATLNTVPVETATGVAAQYQSFTVDFTIDYDIDGPGSELAYGHALQSRIRRLAASADEIAGEVVILGLSARFRTDKIGSLT